MAHALPLFHLYGDPPDDQAFDFIHVETVPSRSSAHDWTIRAHRHRNLFQILLIERGSGEMIYEAARLPFVAPAAILVPAAVAHGFRFEPGTQGWVMSFTEDAAFALADRSGEALSRLRALAAHPIIPIADERELARLSALCSELFVEGRAKLGPRSYRMAMRSLLALIAVDVARLAAVPRPDRQHHGGRPPMRRSRSCAHWSTNISATSIATGCRAARHTRRPLNDHVKRADRRHRRPDRSVKGS